MSKKKAYWIALKAIKYVIKVTDGLKVLQTRTENVEYAEVRRAVFEHFQV
jgi:hypothetical protein